MCNYFEIGSVVLEKMVFKRWHYGEYMCVKMALWGIYVCNYFEIGSVVLEKMVFKRWHYGEYMCVIILKSKLGSVV